MTVPRGADLQVITTNDDGITSYYLRVTERSVQMTSAPVAPPPVTKPTQVAASAVSYDPPSQEFLPAAPTFDAPPPEVRTAPVRQYVQNQPQYQGPRDPNSVASIFSSIAAAVSKLAPKPRPFQLKRLPVRNRVNLRTNSGPSIQTPVLIGFGLVTVVALGFMVKRLSED